MRFSGGRVGARGAKNALMSHVGRLEVVRWTVLSRLALCLMVKIVRTHTARSDMERRRALRNEGGLAVGAAENVGVRRFVDDLSQHVARAEAGSLTNFGNHDGSLRSIMRPSRLVTNPALAALWSGYLLVAARTSQDLFLAAKDLSFAATAKSSGVSRPARLASRYRLASGTGAAWTLRPRVDDRAREATASVIERRRVAVPDRAAREPALPIRERGRIAARKRLPGELSRARCRTSGSAPRLTSYRISGTSSPAPRKSQSVRPCRVTAASLKRPLRGSSGGRSHHSQ